MISDLLFAALCIAIVCLVFVDCRACGRAEEAHEHEKSDPDRTV